MDLKAAKLNTVADIEALDENVRAELIDGKIYYMALPLTVHQRLLTFLIRKIADKLEEAGMDCEVIPAPFGVYLYNDEHNLVEPDISVICEKSKIDEKGCHGAPEWIIEIVSPSSVRMDYSIKLFKYRTAGVKEYWIVDPAKREVLVYDFENGDDYFCYSFEETVCNAHIPELKVDLSKYF